MALFRKMLIEERSKIENRAEKDEAIRARFFSYLPETCARVFIYASCNNEADTTGIIKELLAQGKRVFCPRVEGPGLMHFYEIRGTEDLKPGYMRIPEPTGEVIVCPTEEETDLVVIPGVAFDENGGRMGYGGGFYDRYLAAHPCKKLALAYEVQVRDGFLPHKETDIYMDAVITDRRLRTWED